MVGGIKSCSDGAEEASTIRTSQGGRRNGPDMLFLARIFFYLFIDSYFHKICLVGYSPRDCATRKKKTRNKTGSGWGSYGTLDGCAVS